MNETLLDTLRHFLGRPEGEDAGPKVRAESPFMTVAIREGLEGITMGHGGPFGCVIVKDGKIVGRGHNMVLKNHDSTAHGEVTAIRDAGRRLRTHDLTGCQLYTTAEPCPMCLGAILWANIEKVYYGCTIADTAGIGFRDEQFDRLTGGRAGLDDLMECIDREACLALFQIYSENRHARY